MWDLAGVITGLLIILIRNDRLGLNSLFQSFFALVTLFPKGISSWWYLGLAGGEMRRASRFSFRPSANFTVEFGSGVGAKEVGSKTRTHP